ncbi:MAG: hypothetical protein JXB38_14980 [Anaerolineales bacterium]|nr:hypothetical protein [Anaerolineales bacterium]
MRASLLPPAQCTLAWIAGQPGIAAPVIGPRTFAHFEDCIGAAEVTVTAEDRARIEQVAPPGRAIVPYYIDDNWVDLRPNKYRW